MKNMKITRYILSFAAAAGLLAACQTPEMVQVASPEDVVPASLHELEVSEIAITANNQQEQIKFSWERADYDVPTEVRYSLEAALTEDGKKVNVLSGLKDTTAVLTYEELNRILFNDLEVAEGQATPVKFFIGSVIYAGSSISSYPKVYSQPLTLTVTVTAAEKEYPKVWVIGDYCGWSHDKTQFLFDFVGDDAVFQGVVDFGEKAANGWKVTGVAGWDDTCNWGGDEAVTYEPEAAKTQLINGGGSKDLKHYSKRFYHFSLEKGPLLLTKTIGFNQIGVIGDFNNWGADVVMDFDAKKQKFYADVDFAADGGFKFRLDGAWDISYGTGADGFLTSKDGANIAVKAGKYRVYLNMNNFEEITFELSKGDYGSATPEPEQPQEPEQPEQPAYKGWGIVGSAVGSWDVDTPMTSDGTWHVAKQVALTAGELKFRLDGAWETNLGGATFEANKELALTSGGGNIVVPAGTFDIYLDPTAAKVWFINDGSHPGGGTAPKASEWGVVGDVNGWGSSPDIVMYETATAGLFVAYNAQISAGGIKIRANNEWNDAKNYGLASAGSVEVDHAYDLICGAGSQNMTIAAGSYDIWFDLNNSKAYIMTPGKSITEAEGGSAVAPDPSKNVWGIVGDVNGWAAPDITLEASGTEGLFVAYKVTMPAGKFKIRANGEWNDAANYGLATPGPVEVDHVYDLVCSGGSGDMTLAAGTYDIWFDLKNSKVYIMTPGKPITEAK